MVIMDIETIESLAALVGRSKSVTELELAGASGTLRICRPGAVSDAGAAVVAASHPAVSEPSGVSEPVDEAVIVKAGVVGVFRARRQPLAEGDRVAEGDVLGAIETLRIPSDCLSTVDGIVTAVLVTDGATVEYGQAIARLRKD